MCYLLKQIKIKLVKVTKLHKVKLMNRITVESYPKKNMPIGIELLEVKKLKDVIFWPLRRRKKRKNL